MTAVHCVFYSKIQSNHTLCFINNRKMTIKNSAAPLYKSHNMTTSEAVCTLTVQPLWDTAKLRMVVQSEKYN